MTWAVLGDPWASLLVLVNVMMIVADVGGIMFLCGISLNGVSLVNLVVVRTLYIFKDAMFTF